MSHQSGDEPVPGYRLVSRIGEGGFGEVWKAVGPGGVEMAIKVVPVGGLQSLQEFEALARVIRHPNLLPLHGFWLKADGRLLPDDSYCERSSQSTGNLNTTTFLHEPVAARDSELIIAMGLADMSLADRLKQSQESGEEGIPRDELLDYLESSARAIDFLNVTHALRHCGVKPQNILLSGGGAQVSDVGLARALRDIRRTSISVGIAYSSPELLSKLLPTSTTDQYALAVTYIEMRTGKLPFEEPNDPEQLVRAASTGNLQYDLLPPAERAVLRRATALEPTRRFGTCVAFVRELRAVVARELEASSSDQVGHDAPYGPLLADTLVVGSSRSAATTVVPITSASAGDGLVAPNTVAGFPGLLHSRAWVAGLLALCALTATAYYGSPRGSARRAPTAKELAILKRVEDNLREAKLHWRDRDQAKRSVAVEQATAALTALDELPPSGAPSEAHELRCQALLVRARTRAWLTDDREQQCRAAQADLREFFSLWSRRAGFPATAWPYSLALDFMTKPADSDVLTSLDTLARYKQDSQAGFVEDEWALWDDEKAQLRESRETVRKVALQIIDGRLEQPGTALDICKKLVAVQKDEGVLRKMALLQILLKDLKAAETSLHEAIRFGSVGAGKAIHEEIALIAAVNQLRIHSLDAVSFKNTLQAVRQSNDHNPPEEIAKDVVQLRFLCAEELLNLADSDLSRFADAVAEANATIALLPEKPIVADWPTQEFLLRKWQELAGKEKRRQSDALLKMVVAATPDFPELAERIRDVRNEHLETLIKICRVECNLELKVPLENSQKASQDVFDEQFAEKVDRRDQPYFEYVKALVVHSRADLGDAMQAAKMIHAAFSVEPWPSHFGTHRKKRAFAVLVAGANAAFTLHAPAGEDLTLAALLPSPFRNGDKEADKVYQWLALANRLGELDANSQAMLALAAGSSDEVPRRTLAEDMLTKLQVSDDYPLPMNSQPSALLKPLALLRLWARLRDEQDKQQSLAAIRAYYRVLQRITEDAKASGAKLPAVPLYEEVVKPALLLAKSFPKGESLPAGQARQIGELFAAKGNLLSMNRFEDWRLDDWRAEAIAAFDKALELDERLVAAHVGRGFARLGQQRLSPQDIADAERDANRAIEINRDYPGAHSLLSVAIIRRYRSGLAPDGRRLPPAERVPLAQIAIEESTQAVQFSEPDSYERALALITRGQARVEYVNYWGEMTKDETIHQLQEAVADAEAAAEVDTPYRSVALEALGNALEDLAGIAGVEPERNFFLAIQAFTKAHEQFLSSGRYYFHRGRCRFKAVSDGHFDPSGDVAGLDKATDDLSQALIRDDKLVEAHYWLGRIHEFRGSKGDAIAAYHRAVEGDPDNHHSIVRAAIVDISRGKWDEADRNFSEAFEKARTANEDHRAYEHLIEWAMSIDSTNAAISMKRLPHLLPMFDKLRADDSLEAGMFRGIVLEIQGPDKWGDAIGTYRKAVTSRPLSRRRDYEYYLYKRAAWAGYQWLSHPQVSSNRRMVLENGPEILADAEKAAALAKAAATAAEEAHGTAERELDSAGRKLLETRGRQEAAHAKLRAAQLKLTNAKRDQDAAVTALRGAQQSTANTNADEVASSEIQVARKRLAEADARCDEARAGEHAARRAFDAATTELQIATITCDARRRALGVANQGSARSKQKTNWAVALEIQGRLLSLVGRVLEQRERRVQAREQLDLAAKTVADASPERFIIRLSWVQQIEDLDPNFRKTLPADKKRAAAYLSDIFQNLPPDTPRRSDILREVDRLRAALGA